MPPQKKKNSVRRRGRPAKRSAQSSRPTDWLYYLEPIVRELPVALEILRRLRWAFALKEKGLAVAPWPAGRYRMPRAPSQSEERASNWPASAFGFLRSPQDVLRRLLAPEEMAAKLGRAELKRHLDRWESEVRDWGHAIWLGRGETLRLRSQRWKLRESIETLKVFPGGEWSDSRAARVINDVESNPHQMLPIGKDAQMSHVFAPADEFGNISDVELTDEDVAEFAARPLDERQLRRIYRGESKKGQGGVLDVDTALLGPPPKRDGDEG